MRIRDALQFSKNLIGSIVLEITPNGWPKIKLSGESIWNIHQNPILVQEVVAEGFIEHRILWENFRHEFKFRDYPDHRTILLGSLEKLDGKLVAFRKTITGTSGEEAWLHEILQYLLTKTRMALKSIQDEPTWEAYNKWNDEIDPAREDERMTPKEETANLLRHVRDLRKESYWAWDSLIDFLNEGPIKMDARKKMAEGRESVDLTDSEVEQSWSKAA